LRFGIPIFVILPIYHRFLKSFSCTLSVVYSPVWIISVPQVWHCMLCQDVGNAVFLLLLV